MTASHSDPFDPMEYAYRMGRDCAINGANTTNCNFRIFSTPAQTKEWERGKREAESAVGTAGGLR